MCTEMTYVNTELREFPDKKFKGNAHSRIKLTQFIFVACRLCSDYATSLTLGSDLIHDPPRHCIVVLH